MSPVKLFQALALLRRMQGHPTARERHPIADAPPWTLEARVHYLETQVGRLWDEVWWHQLPWWRRGWYWLHGFRSPIHRFYEPI